MCSPTTGSRLIIRCLVLGCCIFGGTAPVWSQDGQPSSGEVLTLQQAVGTAMENNRPLKVATLGVEKAGDATDALRTRRLPALNLFGLSGRLLTPLMGSARPPNGLRGQALTDSTW